jgi:hypothetical protein
VSYRRIQLCHGNLGRIPSVALKYDLLSALHIRLLPP